MRGWLLAAQLLGPVPSLLGLAATPSALPLVPVDSAASFKVVGHVGLREFGRRPQPRPLTAPLHSHYIGRQESAVPPELAVVRVLHG